MTVLQILVDSKTRAEAITRLIACGFSRQDAKVLTFGLDAREDCKRLLLLEPAAPQVESTKPTR